MIGLRRKPARRPVREPRTRTAPYRRISDPAPAGHQERAYAAQHAPRGIARPEVLDAIRAQAEAEARQAADETRWYGYHDTMDDTPPPYNGPYVPAPGPDPLPAPGPEPEFPPVPPIAADVAELPLFRDAVRGEIIRRLIAQGEHGEGQDWREWYASAFMRRTGPVPLPGFRAGDTTPPSLPDFRIAEQTDARAVPGGILP